MDTPRLQTEVRAMREFGEPYPPEFRRENQRLRQERDILAKAAAWFPREKAPNGPSGS